MHPLKPSFRLAPRQRRIAAALFFCLLSVTLLVYTPRFNSSDGLAMYVTADSLVRRAAFDIEPLRWMGLQQGTFGLDGLLYSRKGLGMPLAALPLVFLGYTLPGLGAATAALLFNSLVTATTAVVIFRLVLRLGLSEKAGWLTALIYGLATPALPYAKSFFSDPFAGLLLLLAAEALLAYRDQRGRRFLLLASLALGWSIATRYAEAMVLPFFTTAFFFLILEQPATGDTRNGDYLRRALRHYREIVAFAAPAMLIGALLMFFNTSRYGNPFDTGYLATETFSAVWWQGILGQLVSPGRGLLLYSPILILCCWGIIPLMRRDRLFSLLAGGVILAHLLVYGKWFMWHGGFAWGPRFMVPALPFLCLFLAPPLQSLGERVVSAGRKPFKHSLALVGTALLLVFSLVTNILGVCVDFSLFQNSLLDTGLPLFDPRTFFEPQYSPLLGSWAFLTRSNLDFAWIQAGVLRPGLLIGLLSAVVIAAACLIMTLRHDNSIAPLLSGVATAVAAVFLLSEAHLSFPAPLQRFNETLNTAAYGQRVIIFDNPALTTPLLELYKGRADIIGLGGGEIEEAYLETLEGRYAEWFWLSRNLDAAGSPERFFLAHDYRLDEQTQQDFRLAHYLRPVDKLTMSTAAADYEAGFRLAGAAVSPALQPGRPVFVELHWQAEKKIPVPYRIFIQLLDERGERLAGQDSEPANWLQPTSRWEAGATITDRHAFLLPTTLPPGKYRLAAGVYDPQSGRRLATRHGEEMIVLHEYSR
jgi:hypothetical protein